MFCCIFYFPALLCQDPGAPENGGRTAASFEINSAVQYYCNEGYQLMGTAVARCLAGATYGSDRPTCQCELVIVQ